MYNINDSIKKAEEEFGLGGDYFKVKEGDNKIRVVSDPVPHQSVFNGKTNFKFVFWVIDRKDSKVKPYFMPKTILESIGALQVNPEYVFEDFPMPFDITINAKGAGSKEVLYQVTPARNNTPLTVEELTALKEKGPIQDYVKGLDSKKADEPAAEPDKAETREPKGEDIPF